MIDIGQSVGNYKVVSKLGEGGMGVVYLAEHPVIGRKAALKAIHAKYARSADVVSRFVTEAKSVNQIGHEHIVDITDFGVTPAGDFYFIMEHLQGTALSDSIKKDMRLAPERALHVAVQIADALQASHDHGVIHRDLKPDNVFLVTHGEDESFVKVLDFGLAKLVDPEAPPTHNTQTGSVMGTPYYMAPEQCEGKVDIDHRVDIYSLGVMLFEMLTGKLPFGGTGYGEIILKHMTMPAPAARSVVPELPSALDAILFRALAKDPALRFQTMSELRAALLDPEGYAASIPAHAADGDISGRFRAARPMARFEMSLPTRLSSVKETATGSSPGRSTFRDGAGEILDVAEISGFEEVVVEEIPRTRHRGLVAGLALMGLILGTAAYTRPASSYVAAARALTRPSTVRLNFSSDPDGATVTRADGSVLGVTPLSTTTPYSDAPIQYVFHKPGFIAKTVALVPNLPSPIFAVLESEPVADPPAAPVEVAAVTPSAEAAPSAHGPAHVSHHHARAPREVDVEETGDDDETLAPTIR